MTIDDIIRHCRRDTRCIGGPERLALCDEVERLRAVIDSLDKDLGVACAECERLRERIEADDPGVIRLPKGGKK